MGFDIGRRQVAGQAVEQEAHVGRALNVGFAAHGVHAAAGDADVAEEELQYGETADVLGTDGMLGESHGVDQAA